MATRLLEADLIELPGGHSPELARPLQLAEMLHGVAATALAMRLAAKTSPQRPPNPVRYRPRPGRTRAGITAHTGSIAVMFAVV